MKKKLTLETLQIRSFKTSGLKATGGEETFPGIICWPPTEGPNPYCNSFGPTNCELCNP